MDDFQTLEDLMSEDKHKENILKSAKFLSLSLSDDKFGNVVDNFKDSDWYEEYDKNWGVGDYFDAYLDWVKSYAYFHLVICKYDTMNDAMDHLKKDYELLLNVYGSMNNNWCD